MFVEVVADVLQSLNRLFLFLVGDEGRTECVIIVFGEFQELIFLLIELLVHLLAHDEALSFLF